VHYVEVDILLTLEQYQQLVPETLACYLPFGTLIIFERSSVPLSHVSGVCEKPLSLLRWENSSQTLEGISQQVSIVFTMITYVRSYCI
jgi:hypothetical protein